MTLDATLARWAPTFLLLLARCGGIVAFTPVLGTRALPPPARAGLAAALALLLTPLAVGRGLSLPADGPALAASLAGELAIGAVLGVAARFTFAAIGMAGELAGVQMGLGLPAALDPHSQTQVSAVNHITDQVAIMVFLAAGGHHAVLAALAHSLAAAPPLSVNIRGDVVGYLAGLFGAALQLAVRMAAPATVATLAAMTALGLLNRIAPNLNLFMVSFPILVGVGLLVLLAALPVYGMVLVEGFRDLPGIFEQLLARMRHGL